MTVRNEFYTVDLIKSSKAETRGIDSFALSLIKAERQIRRLITFLIFQSPAFDVGNIKELRDTLGKHQRLYFRHFLAAWNDLYINPLSGVYGKGYNDHHTRLIEATEIRNKIFHGQLTDKHLNRDKLFEYVNDIEHWCTNLSKKAKKEIGYDGFDRSEPNGSFRKSTQNTISQRLKSQINTIDEYDSFLKNLEKYKLR